MLPPQLHLPQKCGPLSPGCVPCKCLSEGPGRQRGHDYSGATFTTQPVADLCVSAPLRGPYSTCGCPFSHKPGALSLCAQLLAPTSSADLAQLRSLLHPHRPPPLQLGAAPGSLSRCSPNPLADTAALGPWSGLVWSGRFGPSSRCCLFLPPYRDSFVSFISLPTGQLTVRFLQHLEGVRQGWGPGTLPQGAASRH